MGLRVVLKPVWILPMHGDMMHGEGGAMHELKKYPGARTFEGDWPALVEYLSTATDVEHKIRLLLDAENRMRRWLLAMGVDPELPTSDVLYGHYLMHWVGRERRILHGPMAVWSGEYSLAG